MSYILDVALNLVAAALGFLIAQAMGNVREWRKYRDAKRFWKRFTADGLRIVLPHFDKYTPHEKIGLIGAGEVQGLMHLNAFLAPLSEHEHVSILADDIGGEMLRGNLLVLGGPVTNALHRELTAMLHPDVTFRRGTDGIYTLVDGYSHTLIDGYSHFEYLPSFDSETGEVEKDYCLINVLPNPHDPDCRVMLIAGLGSYGTWGGIQFTTTKEFLQNKVVKSNNPFEALIEVEVTRFTPIPHLLAIYAASQK